jgi:hypothetical protein
MDLHNEFDETQTEELAQTDRRGFFQGIKKWSTVVLAGIVLGSATTKESRAGWLNRRGGGGWLNRPGGGGWLNRRGIGGWLNRR